MTRIIGLTGGIGSGKSTVARFFEELGVSVYYADDRAKAIMSDTVVIEAISKEFGKEVLENDVIHRGKLAEIVFHNPDKLKTLNAIVHPAVQKDFEDWVKSKNQEPYILKEAAILFESGSYKNCDQIITVTAPEKIRIERVMKRNATSEKEVRSRMNNQWPESEKIALSDFVIENLDLSTTKSNVSKIHKILINM